MRVQASRISYLTSWLIGDRLHRVGGGVCVCERLARLPGTSGFSEHSFTGGRPQGQRAHFVCGPTFRGPAMHYGVGTLVWFAVLVVLVLALRSS